MNKLVPFSLVKKKERKKGIRVENGKGDKITGKVVTTISKGWVRSTNSSFAWFLKSETQ